MKFEYINYEQSLLQQIKNNPDTVYIFSSYILKNSVKKELKSNILEPGALYLTFDEFKEKLYKTDKVILQETKRFISFYTCLKNEFKDININNYFESIEFATQFFNYYSEINSSNSIENIKFEKWQKKYFEKFDEFKKKYDNYLNKNNYIPKEWIENIHSLDFSYLNGYKKLIFIDIVTFSQLDKILMQNLNDKFEITIKIQGEKYIFDEKNFELNKILLPEKQNTDIYLMEVSDRLELAINLLNLVKNKKNNINIYSPQEKDNDFYKIFCNDFIKGTRNTLNDTKFYKFLEKLEILISAIEPKMNNMIEISKFLLITNSLEFQEFFCIENEDIEYIKCKIDNDFKYIGMENNDTITQIYKHTLDIFNMKSLDEFTIYFNQILKLEQFKEPIYLNFYEKLQEYLRYAKTTESMLGKKELNSCFKTGGDILKFILQYFNTVELRTKLNTENKHLIKNLEISKSIYSDEAIFIDISTEYIPTMKKNNLFLTEYQKKMNGFSYYEKERKEEKYRFYQSLLKNKKNIFIYVKDKNTGETLSPIMEDILKEYKCNYIQKNISNQDVLELLLKYKSSDLKNYKQTDLIKVNSDYLNNNLNIGAYDYNILSVCPYRFYLAKICGLKKFNNADNFNISLKFLGIFIHETLEKTIDLMWKKILNYSDYYLDYDTIQALLMKLYLKNKTKIPVYLDNYFKDILIPKFSENIMKFYNLIEQRYKKCKVLRFEAEKNSKKNPFIEAELNINLIGRVDFVLETNNENHIIDFKTGNKIDNQLDFYTIMLYGNETSAEKSIYNVFDGNIEPQKNLKLTREKLKENIIKFIKDKTYLLSEKRTDCTYCDFENICRKEG